MENDQDLPIEVSRRIDAPASRIFDILSDPSRHPAIDGSGMLREGASNPSVTAVGDVFSMKMYFPKMGDYVMDNHVVEFERHRRIAWEPVLRGASRTTDDPARNGSRWGFTLTSVGPDATVVTETYDCSGSPDSVRKSVDNGNAWVENMADTLERLDELCTGAS